MGVMGARGVVGVGDAGPGHAESLALGPSFGRWSFSGWGRVGMKIEFVGKWLTVLVPAGVFRAHRNLLASLYCRRFLAIELGPDKAGDGYLSYIIH